LVIDPKVVRHSKCGKDLKMQMPYNIANFKTHVYKCTGPPKSSKTPGGGMMTIDMIFKKQLDAQPLVTTSNMKKMTLPCPGLRKGDNMSTESYLEHTVLEVVVVHALYPLQRTCTGKPIGNYLLHTNNRCS